MNNEEGVQLQFSVGLQSLRSWETVYVVGSVPELGSWSPRLAIPLTRSNEDSLWHGQVDIKVSTPVVEFRYFIGAYLDAAKPNGNRVRIIVKWEASLRPRRFHLTFGGVDGIHKSKDTFGEYDGRSLIGDGWITNPEEHVFYLRIHGHAMKFYKQKDEAKTYRIKVVPFDVRFKEGNSVDEDETWNGDIPLPQHPSFSETELSVLTRTDPLFGEQYHNGSIFRNNVDYLVFRTRTVAIEHLTFCLELYESDSTKRIGVAYALPSALPDTYGKSTVLLINKHQQPIGQIHVDYMLASCFKTDSVDLRDNMSFSYARHWKKRTTVEVGHRGMGNSYTKGAMARENTIHSLNSAASKGADFVEFDVQLTKDRVAVIYHDFHVLVEVAQRKSDEELNKHHEMAVKDLKRHQLTLLHLEHCAMDKRPADSLRVTPQIGEETAADQQPFPSLAEALQRVDEAVGFNIEVKYPMLQKDGLHECENYFERNSFIDIILNDVFENSGTRRIIFSSFDPDICTLISQKQHRFPVLFLVVGATTRYVPFEDIRSDSSVLAVNYAAGSRLLGLNFHSEELLKDREPVDRAQMFNLVTFVWGDDVNQKENQEYFKNVLGLDGIIYDRIGEFEERKSIFVVEREAKSALFSRSAAATPCASRRGSLEDFGAVLRKESKETLQKLSELAVVETKAPRSPKRAQSFYEGSKSDSRFPA